MKYLNMQTITDFKCVGSECPYTCCAGGWKIAVDSNTDAYYQTVTGDFGVKLKQCISRENEPHYFILTESGRCPFLNDQNLCDIYINLGEDHLCKTCTSYPRYGFVAGDVQFGGVSISCPEVAKFLLKHKEKLQIDFAEKKKKEKIESWINWEVFNNAIRAYTIAVEMAQDREYAMNERLAALTIFLFQFQSYIDTGKDPSGLFELFSDHSNFSQILPQSGIYNRDLDYKAGFLAALSGFFRRIKGFERTLPELYELVAYFVHDDQITVERDKLNSAYLYFDDKETQIWLEQILVYTLHRYFMQGFKKKDFYTKYITGAILVYELIISTVVLHYIRWDQAPDFDATTMIVAHISRAIEHDPKFRDAAIELLKEKGFTDPAYLLKLFG